MGRGIINIVEETEFDYTSSSLALILHLMNNTSKANRKFTSYQQAFSNE